MTPPKSARLIVLGGVSGSGKSRVGKLLAEAMAGEFFDGDDFHPPANKEKMQRKEPLTDDDRQPWLQNLARLLKERAEQAAPTVVACSALKQSYRNILKSHPSVEIVLLIVSRAELTRRLSGRKGHFFPPELLESQLRTLQPPINEANVWTVDGERSPQEIVREVQRGQESASP